jgi:hypothetical protein
MGLGAFFLLIFLLGLLASIVFGTVTTGISPTISRPSHAMFVAKKISKLPQIRVIDAGSG